jgi:hypothetical protein
VFGFTGFAPNSTPKPLFVLTGAGPLTNLGRSLAIGSYYGDGLVQIAFGSPTESIHGAPIQSGVCISINFTCFGMPFNNLVTASSLSSFQVIRILDLGVLMAMPTDQQVNISALSPHTTVVGSNAFGRLGMTLASRPQSSTSSTPTTDLIIGETTSSQPNVFESGRVYGLAGGHEF